MAGSLGRMALHRLVGLHSPSAAELLVVMIISCVLANAGLFIHDPWGAINPRVLAVLGPLKVPSLSPWQSCLVRPSAMLQMVKLIASLFLRMTGLPILRVQACRVRRDRYQ
jgi:hypothetical protein